MAIPQSNFLTRKDLKALVANSVPVGWASWPGAAGDGTLEGGKDGQKREPANGRLP
jgi:hypothetical protein